MLRLRLALVAVVVCALAGVGIYVARRGDETPQNVPLVPTPPGATHGKAVPDPLAWTPERSADFVRRATQGTSHLLYERSPGGVALSAERTMRYRPLVERAAKAARVDPNRLEALVFLESAGRPDALAPGSIEGAAGLTQILAETARNLLGLKVDSARSAAYTRRIDRAVRRRQFKRAGRLTRARKRVDQRFDPAHALAAAGRYLTLARRRFGREDLAFVSYHMGIGNLESVLRAYGQGRVPYAQLYFDSTPLHHAAAYEKLAAFGDDSSNYYWKLGAAMEILRLARHDHAKLARLNALQTQAPDARLVLHPPGTAPTDDLKDLPDAPANTGLRAPPGARLRPEALGAALYIGAQVRAISHARALRVLTTTPWSFTISRKYASRRQALAFQYVLDRLQVLNVIAWSREPRTITVTAAKDAEVLSPLLDRAEGR